MKRSRSIPWPQPSSVPSSADPQDQLQSKPNEPVVTVFAVQSPFHAAGVSTNLSADVDILDDSPTSQPRSSVIETHGTSSSQH